MSDLTPEDKALIELARGGNEPTSLDRNRVSRALVAQLGVASGLATAKTSSAAAGSAAASATAKQRSDRSRRGRHSRRRKAAGGFAPMGLAFGKMMTAIGLWGAAGGGAAVIYLAASGAEPFASQPTTTPREAASLHPTALAPAVPAAPTSVVSTIVPQGAAEQSAPLRLLPPGRQRPIQRSHRPRPSRTPPPRPEGLRRVARAPPPQMRANRASKTRRAKMARTRIPKRPPRPASSPNPRSRDPPHRRRHRCTSFGRSRAGPRAFRRSREALPRGCVGRRACRGTYHRTLSSWANRRRADRRDCISP